MSVISKKVAESELNVVASDDEILWPEWSDADLNKENWASPKNGEDELFLDTHIVQLPPSLKPYVWIRAMHLENLTEPLTVFADYPEQPDLISNNNHLLHSEFMRWFISAVINLQYCGLDGLEISGENGDFVWNCRNQPWRGWMHIYSMNKAGNGVHHQPIINPNGKYVARVYFLGRWRYMTIDDIIPVNQEYVPLLPRTANNYELWPMLLAKALLKLSSLTSSRNREIVDFHPINCLTGWVCLRLDISYLTPQDKWDFLRKYAEHFEWPPDAFDRISQDVTTSKISIERIKSKETATTKKSKDSERSRKTKQTDRSKKSKDTEDNGRKLSVLSKPQPVTVFLGLDDMQGLAEEAVPGISPCLGHFIYVAQSRDIPLDPKDVKPPLARWKLYRWLKWAIDEGIIDPVEYFVPIRSLKVISPLRKCEESIINKCNNSMEDVSHGDTNDKSAGGPSVDDIFWADFNKMEPYVKDIHFFYKLDYFEYTTRISDSIETKQPDQKTDIKKKSNNKKDSARSSPSRGNFKEPDFIQAYGWPRKMRKSRNEPLYIFVDSVEDKFFLISFSTFQASIEESTDSFSTIKAEESHLIVEKHSWLRRPKQLNCLASIVTAGTQSTVMELKPGRYLLRVYCRSESHCFITISSDTIFHIGDKKTMFYLMSTESEMVNYMVKRISNAIGKVYRSFGTEDYPRALKDYYTSYMPIAGILYGLNKVLRIQIHKSFLDEKVQLLRKFLPPNEVSSILRSVRVFFMNNEIGFLRADVVSQQLRMRWSTRQSGMTMKMPLDDDDNDDGDVDATANNNNSMNKYRAASIIQAFFKTQTIKKYKKIHNPRHEEHQHVLQNLLKIVELFNYNKRESLASQLLRSMLEKYDNLDEVYYCFKDFKNTLQVQELNGTLANVKANQWVPIARFQVNARVRESVHASVNLFINLPKYSVRVFNNETGQELVRLVNNVAPMRYEYSLLGYTVIAYGWNDDQVVKDLPWTINIISMRGKPLIYYVNDGLPFSGSTVLPTLVVEEFSSNYIPNSRRYISKWIVKVVKRIFVSFRLRASYDQVKIEFKVSDKDRNVYSLLRGTSVIIVPVLCLGTDQEPGQQHLKAAQDVDENDDADNNKNVDDNDKNVDDNDNMEDCGESNIDVRESDSKEDGPGQKFYIVEAFVRDGSWPLTKSEWTVVADAKTKTLHSPSRLKVPSVPSVGKVSRSEVLRARRGSKESSEGVNQALDHPYWVLQVVTDSGSALEITQDRTKEKELVKMKEAWAKENPDSLQRGREYREEFLMKYDVHTESLVDDSKKKSSTSLKKDSQRKIIVDCSDFSTAKSEMRTLKPLQVFQMLPPLHLSAYKIKEEEEDIVWLKTLRDEEALRSARLMNIIYAQEDYAIHTEETHNVLRMQRKRYRALLSKHKDSFWEGRAMLDQVYEGRKDFINSVKPVRLSSAKSSAKRSSKSKKVQMIN